MHVSALVNSFVTQMPDDAAPSHEPCQSEE